MQYEVNESDWKLFRSRITEWQENYMESLVAEYVIHLQDGAKSAADRFWELENRIQKDKQYSGVACEMRRSALLENMLRLYREGAIEDADLVGFSDELVTAVKTSGSAFREEDAK